MSIRILLVEDENNLGATLKEYLENKNFHVSWAQDYSESIEFLKKNTYDIAILDIGLPDHDGFEVAKKIRLTQPDTSFMFLSAQNDPDTKVQGLELGAQDYMTKPFNLKELSYRLEKIIQYVKQNENSSQLSFGPLKIWFKRYQIQDAEERIISLGVKECELLKLLLERSPNAVSRDEIITHIWGDHSNPSYRTVDNYIVSLRKWSETDPDKNIEIKTIRGIGYQITIKHSQII